MVRSGYETSGACGWVFTCMHACMSMILFTMEQAEKNGVCSACGWVFSMHACVHECKCFCEFLCVVKTMYSTWFCNDLSDHQKFAVVAGNV